MNKFYLLAFTAFVFSSASSAQHVQWLKSVTNNYSLNPEMPQQQSCLSGNNIYAVRMTNYSLNYGIDIFGSMAIERFDSSGANQWSFPFGPKAVVHSIRADESGNVFVAGMFMETLTLGTDSMTNTSVGLNTNLFLFSLDNAGNLRWKRNFSVTDPDSYDLSALSIDQQGRCWYALGYFDSTSVRQLSVSGTDVMFHHVYGTRTLSSISFDDHDNMFLAGSSGSITMTINGFSVNVPDPYMMFVARVNASGNTSWIKMISDVTFQSPEVVATTNGDAVMSGNLMVGAAFGTIVFNGPQWVYDIFVTKIDSSGNFLWGIEVPETQTITGDFMRGKDNFIDADAAGNIYLTGTLRGSVDWGNGVISDAGAIPSYGVSTISFDANGIARWQITGGGTGFVTPYSLSVASTDECYFSSGIVGPVTFDSVTTNQGGNNFAFMLGKISDQSPVNVSSIVSENNFTAYPNPANDFIRIHLDRNYFSDPVVIYNIFGEKVQEFFPTKEEMQIGVSELASGLYFLTSGNTKEKILVQHE